MKVSELMGAELDYWVARAEGHESYYPADSTNPERWNWLRHGEFGSAVQTPKYSCDWAAAGPIIEREDIGWCEGHAAIDMRVQGAEDCYGAYGEFTQRGDTPLIAAMRCFVSSQFGDNVPDE